jgi:hypothetical protein
MGKTKMETITMDKESLEEQQVLRLSISDRHMLEEA